MGLRVVKISSSRKENKYQPVVLSRTGKNPMERNDEGQNIKCMERQLLEHTYYMCNTYFVA